MRVAVYVDSAVSTIFVVEAVVSDYTRAVVDSLPLSAGLTNGRGAYALGSLFG